MGICGKKYGFWLKTEYCENFCKHIFAMVFDRCGGMKIGMIKCRYMEKG